MDRRLQEFQRNSAFVAFMVVVCFAAFVYLAGYLQSVVTPLIWSGFFAVPLNGLITRIDAFTVRCARCLCRRVLGTEAQPQESWHFIADHGQSFVRLRGEAATSFVEQAMRPVCGLPRQVSHFLFPRRSCRILITRLEATRIGVGDNEVSDGNAVLKGPEVNRLVKGWKYYVDVDHNGQSLANNMDVAPTNELSHNREVNFWLYLDKERRYPAVLDMASTEEGTQGSPGSPDSPEPLPRSFTVASWHTMAVDNHRRVRMGRLAGSFEMVEGSSLTWSFALIVALVIMTCGVWIFTEFVAYGIAAFKDNLHIYQKGLVEFIDWVRETLSRVLSKESWDEIEAKARAFVKDALPNLASDLASYLEGMGWEFLLFLVYLLFWVFEPLPLSSPVANVFTSYLYLKTLMCILFAGLMSLLLYALSCPIWHLYFIVMFLLNYIPEVGAILSAALTVPAVIFDGRFPMYERIYHLSWLVVCGTLIKVITGNVIEVRAYATRGGQFMRMHPVVLMALMMFCSSILGLTGMFLAIPMVAAVKYYMITANMPGVILNPVLVLVEGDECGPHKNFVDRHRSLAEDQISRSVLSNGGTASPSVPFLTSAFSGGAWELPRVQDAGVGLRSPTGVSESVAPPSTTLTTAAAAATQLQPPSRTLQQSGNGAELA